PYTGRLSNRGGRIALERPQAPDLPGEGISWVIVDELIYFDRQPWPNAADATGLSLHRLDGDMAGRNPNNWREGLPSPSNNALVIPLPHPDLLKVGDNRYRLQWDVLPGLDYTVEASDSLLNPNWESLGTVNTNGTATFIDEAPTNRMRRYYRVRR
ncbi:MAG: hypothetical protein AAF492_23225, partial [Verrucomicrobiota bacterium]